jgi:ubiquinol-cytochrome c reductase iron-sulfur subunit
VTRPRREGRDEVVISFAFFVAAIAALALAIVYWRGGQPQLEGTFLAIAAGGIAVGLIFWARWLLPNERAVEERESGGSAPAERAAFDADLNRDRVLSRRRFVRGSLVGAIVALGAAFLLPLRSLGPRPRDAELDASPWHDGVRLINEGGSRVRAEDVPADGLVTVFPEGAPNSESGQAVLVRVDPALIRPLAGRDAWTPDGLIAYSKVCTHAGCPVGLYEATSHQLLCPCHQSTFDVLDGAQPVFGPAAQRLPQLPLAIDTQGYLYATGGFSEPPGPAYWDRAQ